jgi:hypothetical protein
MSPNAMTRTSRPSNPPSRLPRFCRWVGLVFTVAAHRLHAAAEFWPPARSFLQ